MLVPPKLRGSPTAPHSRRLEGHLRHRWQHSNSRRAHPPHCLHARAHPAWWRGNGAGCLRAGQVSCTLNTDRTRDSAGRKVGLRTTRKGEPPHPAVTNPIPLPRASLSFLVKQPGGLGCKLHSKCSKARQAQNLNPGQDTRANKPRNEHTNADTKAHTKAHTSTDQPTNQPATHVRNHGQPTPPVTHARAQRPSS